MSLHRPALVRALVVPLLWMAAPDSRAGAQASAPQVAAAGHASVAQSPSPRLWEIEGYGGAALGRALAGGTRAVPTPGSPILTSSPTVPSRQVSSWFFGDGARLLNDVNQQLGVASQVTPLDSAFGPLSSSTAGAAGVRVRRTLTSRFSAEFGVDVLMGSSAAGLEAAVAATRDSFKTAFAGLLATGPFSNVVVEATSATKGATGGDLVASGAVNLRFAPIGAFVPYVTAGAGVMTGVGQLPSATIDAHYQFSILGTVPIDETDHVTLRYARAAALVGVFGGGLRHDLSGDWGLRIDGRVFVGGNDTRLLLDAAPTVTRGTPADYIESFTSPEIQFSNDPGTGRQTTLSGAPIQGFKAFAGGIQTRVVVSVGVFKKF